MEFRKYANNTKVEVKAYSMGDAYMMGILAEKIKRHGCYHYSQENYSGKECISITVSADLKIFTIGDLYRYVGINKVDMSEFMDEESKQNMLDIFEGKLDSLTDQCLEASDLSIKEKQKANLGITVPAVDKMREYLGLEK